MVSLPLQTVILHTYILIIGESLKLVVIVKLADDVGYVGFP